MIIPGQKTRAINRVFAATKKTWTKAAVNSFIIMTIAALPCVAVVISKCLKIRQGRNALEREIYICDEIDQLSSNPNPHPSSLYWPDGESPYNV